MDNENKIRGLSKQINNLSARFDHDFMELIDAGVDFNLISDTMQDDLTYEIERIVTRFELKHPDLYIVGVTRHDDEDGKPEVVLDWVDLNEEDLDEE